MTIFLAALALLTSFAAAEEEVPRKSRTWAGFADLKDFWRSDYYGARAKGVLSRPAFAIEAS